MVQIIIKYVERLIESRKVLILRKRFRPDEDPKVNVTLDSAVKDVLVAVSGYKPAIHVGSKLNDTIIVEHIADTEKAKIIAWNNTEPGDYHIEIKTGSGTINTLLTIYGTSKITFSYGFSVLKPKYMNETTNRPVAGK
ncbi:PREDICTED: uncharacterized protein LOC106119903 [Papilio xuthus]|uniref:Uncharacterized protein LOC106119903 n=1 Tax=Papilio xuthus TaxID=66420 RepID=A0AAJ6ZDN2_PAPXU|nr:PREDICTED: uncharacterized protein LOC106119903 [Papilio xuthus]